MRFIYCCFVCLRLCFPSMAQVPVPESPIKQAADKLVAVTKDGYYAKLIISSNARAVNPCAVTLCRQTPLPVTLIRFSGTRINEASVLLFWETSQEVNNSYFQVERTLNPASGYNVVGLVNGAGTSASTVRYQITDPNSYAGYTYYRLKQVDNDGHYAYSSVVAVKGGLAALSVNAFPNPGQSKNLAFKINGLEASGPLSLIISDVLGRIIYQNLITVASGSEIFKADLSGVLPGKYHIKIKNKDREAISSFILVP